MRNVCIYAAYSNSVILLDERNNRCSSTEPWRWRTYDYEYIFGRDHVWGSLRTKNLPFKAIAKQPRGVITGFISQFLFLPAITLVLIWLLEPYPSFALGMMMVAACPGGNISNFFSQLAGGNTALSVSLTAIATLLAVIATPLNFTFWASLYPPTAEILREIQVDLIQVFQIVGLILGIPLILGMLVSHCETMPCWTSWIKRFGIVFFGGFVIVAFILNYRHFLGYAIGY